MSRDWSEKERRKKAKDPDLYRAKEKARRERRKAKDPEAFRAKEREKERRRPERRRENRREYDSKRYGTDAYRNYNNEKNKEWRLNNPEKYKEIQDRYAAKRPHHVRRIRRATYLPHQPAPGEVFKRQLRSDALYAAASAAVRSSLDMDTRADAISSIILAVLEGHFTIEEIPKHAKRMIAACYPNYADISMDAPLRGNADATLHDVLY